MELLEVVYCGRFHLRRQVKRDTTKGLSQPLTTKTEKMDRPGPGAVKKVIDRANKGEEGGKGKKPENDTRAERESVC